MFFATNSLICISYSLKFGSLRSKECLSLKISDSDILFDGLKSSISPFEFLFNSLADPNYSYNIL